MRDHARRSPFLSGQSWRLSCVSAFLRSRGRVWSRFLPSRDEGAVSLPTPVRTDPVISSLSLKRIGVSTISSGEMKGVDGDPVRHGAGRRAYSDGANTLLPSSTISRTGQTQPSPTINNGR